MKAKIGWSASVWGCAWLLSWGIGTQMLLSDVIAAPIKLKLPPPPQRGLAGNRSAAASRDKCPEVAQPLTALIPEYRSAQGNRVWGLTGMERPTFWVYVPYSKDSIVDISFTIQDESNPADTKIVYQNHQLAPAAKPGVMRIDVPESSEPLAVNKPYHWFVKLNMGCTNGRRPIFVDGWVQRQELDRNLLDRLDRATPAAKVALYADNGLWYDALTTLAKLRTTKSSDPSLSQDWQNLLDSIDLGYLASQPLSDNRQSQRRSQPVRDTGF